MRRKISARYRKIAFTRLLGIFGLCCRLFNKWCPFKEELLTLATWLDFEWRLEKNFNSVEYFVHKFPNIFGNINIDKLSEQFVSYQTLCSDDVPSSVKLRSKSSGQRPPQSRLSLGISLNSSRAGDKS